MKAFRSGSMWVLPASTLAMMVMAIAFGTGCARTARPEQPAPVASRDRVQQLRESYQRVNPNARVGVVTAVLPDENLAAVGDVPVGDFEVGQSMTITDANGDTLAIGQIVRITGDSLHLKYPAPPAGHRAPQVGDLAVRVQ